MGELKKLTAWIRESGLIDSEWYLRKYPDVLALGIDPAEHFARFGYRLGRRPNPGACASRAIDRAAEPTIDAVRRIYLQAPGESPGFVQTPDVSVIVPVFNALEDVKLCLRALEERADGYAMQVIVVNDGSDADTTRWLRQYCESTPGVDVIEHPQNQGYTRAINTGLRASVGEFVVTLNSDTIVTHGWIHGMVRCMRSSSEIGIVGPLSNAATWQNVPELYGEDGQFAINALPEGLSPDEMARVVLHASARSYPRAAFINGFCMMIRRQVLDRVGFMDEEAFPVGYGEENDLCMRAADAGFTLAIADDSYVFHAKSKSFGHERRKELSRQGTATLERKHGRERFRARVAEVRITAPMDRVRDSVKSALRVPGGAASACKGVLFLLPVAGGGGGAHSVVQEVQGMRDLGIRAKVGVEEHHLQHYLSQYKLIPAAEDLFAPIDEATLPLVADGFDIVVATIFTSVALLKRLVDRNPALVAAYYVQDYEPLFFEEGTERWREARASYSLVKDCVLFAKTRWIAEQVWKAHGIAVSKVAPSIDHGIYRPGKRDLNGPLRVAAMIRPRTPRRGARRTMRVLGRIAETLGDAVAFDLFGSASDEPEFVQLPRNFRFTNHGVLTREQVAELLGQCHIFVDLSDYQAFGRTGLEAMACGAVSVVPARGGADEYAIDGVNAVLVDTSDEDACFRRIKALLESPERLRSLAATAKRTANEYSVRRAAVTEWEILSQALEKRVREVPPEPLRPSLYLIPARSAAGSYEDIAYKRAILPFSHPEIHRRVSVVLCQRDAPLPTARPGDTVLLQGEPKGITREELESWISSWKEAGGRLIWDNAGTVPAGEASQQGRNPRGLAEIFAGRCDASDVMVQPVGVNSAPSSDAGRPHVFDEVLDEHLWQLGAPRNHAEGPYARESGKIRIGMIGKPNDLNEWLQLADSVSLVEAEYGSAVEVEVIGIFEKEKPVFGRRVGLPRGKSYPNYVRWLQQRVHWDIGLIAPLRDGASMMSTLLKYAALDLAIVCPVSSHLRSISRHGDIALVAESTTNYVAAIRSLVADPSLRQRISTAARDAVREHFSTRSRAPDYIRLVLGDMANDSYSRQFVGTTRAR